MSVTLRIQSESSRKRLYRKDNLQKLAETICAGEGIAEPVEVSVLFVDDARMQEINRTYRRVNKPTDVLSFEQEGAGVPGLRLLGDIVISLETAEERHPQNPAGTRDEVRLLFVHGMLHLLHYDHDTAAARREMIARQARYLNCSLEAAWFSPK